MKATRHRLIQISLLVLLTSGRGLFAAESAAETGSDPGEAATATKKEPVKSDTTDLAKKTQNPVASLISVPLQNNFSFGVGPDDGVQYVGNLQPVIPVGLGESWNMINRPIVPVVYQPRLSPTQGSEWGLGDIQYQAYFSPARPGALIWGVGPVLSFPSATEDVLGSGKWSAGPAVVALTVQGPWVLGANVLNQWSFAGDSDRQDVNSFLVQPFVNYNMPGGWYLTTSPIITANWMADSDERWTVPLGGGFGKIFKIGSQPVNMQLHAYGYAEKPTGGPEWGLRFQFQLLFPK